MKIEKGMEVATFAGGVFLVYRSSIFSVKRNTRVVSGYIGGETIDPTYKYICTGETGHAEAIQITFAPDIISYGALLEIFFATHDPTTLNRQGNVIGAQYRNEIFFAKEDQKEVAEAYIALLTRENTFGEAIVTEISPASLFYMAENYHQNYLNQNKLQGYCSYVSTPKVEKVKKIFKDMLKN